VPTPGGPSSAATVTTPANVESQTAGVPAGAVPTAVDAGVGGAQSRGANAGSGSFGILGGGLVAAGGLLLAVGAFVALRRRGRHSV
jgi:hypothetical protein